jgi:hypothetical protein
MIRTIRWTVAIALAVGVSACGDDEPSAYTTEQLQSVLLTTADLGQGWEDDLPEVDRSQADAMPVFDAGMWCPESAERSAVLETMVGERAVTTMKLAGAARHTFHGVTEQAWSSADASQFYEIAAGAITTCYGQEWGVGEEAQASVVELAGPTYADATTHAVVQYVTPSPDGDFAWRARMSLIRDGATILVLSELEVRPVGADPTYTDAQWWALAERTVERLDSWTSR